MNLSDKKSIFSSKTVIGVLIAVAIPAAGLFGFNINPETTVEIEGIFRLGAENIESLVSLFGGLVAIYGRIKAKKRIG